MKPAKAAVGPSGCPCLLTPDGLLFPVFATISDLYETTTPDPALHQVLELKVSHMGGAKGHCLEPCINLEEASIDVEWKGRDDVAVELSFKGKVLYGKRTTVNRFRFKDTDLLRTDLMFVIEAREDKRKGMLLGTVEFTLAHPASMKKRGRIMLLRQLVERTVANVSTDQGWKKFLPWASQVPVEELRFNAAIAALLGEGKSLVPQISGVDIAIVISESATLKSWLIMLPRTQFIEVARRVEDKAHEADIRDSELITNRMVKLLFGK